MKGLVGFGALTAVLAVLLLSATPSLAIDQKYIESFTASQYKEALNTTAWWDTLAGELKLFPFVPTLVGSYSGSTQGQEVTVSGDYAFVADYYDGFQVIDISDPTNPTLVGTYNTPDRAVDVSVSGEYAFVADYESGLQVIDVSDPASPTLAATYNTPGQAEGVAVSGDHAFVADKTSGLQVIDISDPTTPTLVGTYDTPGGAYGVTVWGDHAFVADGISGLQVIDISDPTTPTLAGTYDTPGEAIDVTVSGDHVFVADYLSGLQVIDISDPASPTLVGSYNTPGAAYGVTVSGDHAFVADFWGSGLQVIDISDPTTPTLVGSYDTNGAYDVAVSGDRAYVADYGTGILVIDISDPTNPTLVGTCNTPASAYRLSASGDHAFVADLDYGLQVIDVSDPTNPTLVGSYETVGDARGVAVSGDHAFVAVYGWGLEVIDISDPAYPALAGICYTPEWATAVAVSGNHAFVTGDGLHVIDISDPTNPTVVGSSEAGGGWYVTVAGEHAFVAANESGLQVIQVFQSEFDSGKNIGRSLAVDASNDTILKARLVTTQTDTVTWELSGNGGASWQGITPNGSWNQVTVPGSDLLWRSTHRWVAPGVNPTVGQLEIDWLYEFPGIDAITDIGNDQGRQVQIEWTRSANDFVGASPQITEYAIYRRIDPVAATGGLEGATTPRGLEPNAAPIADSEIAVAMAEGWNYVTTVPAEAEDGYSVVVPTLADSTIDEGQHWTVFYVRARTATPGIHYDSYPDSGYSVDNLVPGVPGGFVVAYNTGSGNSLTWEESEDEDFQYFCIYRSTSPEFTPGVENRVGMTAGTEWTDPDYDGWEVYYKITAVDFSGNESDPSSAGTMTAVTETVIPQTWGLHPNVPNPFNPSTTIRYDVPAGGGEVTLRIYDVSGSLIRTLVDGQEAAGEKTVTWNGKDDRGRGVASGVYFYRLQAPGYEKTLKMTLVQ